MEDIVAKFAERYNRLPTERDPDYLEMLRMSKYRVLAFPDFKPGKCANCGCAKNDGSRKYVDFGLEIDWYGMVYLCTLCLTDIAKNAGLFDEQDKKIEEITAAALKLSDLQEQGTTLHDNVVKAFTEFKDYYAGLHPTGDNSSPDNSSDMGAGETVDPEPKSDNSESKSTKSTNGTGRKNVPSLADLIERNT